MSEVYEGEVIRTDLTRWNWQVWRDDRQIMSGVARTRATAWLRVRREVKRDRRRARWRPDRKILPN